MNLCNNYCNKLNSNKSCLLGSRNSNMKNINSDILEEIAVDV